MTQENPSISMAYIQGIQSSLVENGLVRYAMEEEANADAAQLGQGMEQMPVDQGGLAAEGAAPEETQVIAQALGEMAAEAGEQAQVASAKADIVQEAVTKVASFRKTEFSKFAMEAKAPGDNNVIAGHKPGSIAAGESNAKKTDKDTELTNAVDNTVHREDVFHSMPGVQSDKNKGHIGSEAPHPGKTGTGAAVGDLKELVNAMPNTRERANAHGGPGEQADEMKGEIGVEKGASLSSVLSKL